MGRFSNRAISSQRRSQEAFGIVERKARTGRWFSHHLRCGSRVIGSRLTMPDERANRTQRCNQKLTCSDMVLPKDPATSGQCLLNLSESPLSRNLSSVEGLL